MQFSIPDNLYTWLRAKYGCWHVFALKTIKISCYSNLQDHSYLKVLRNLQTLNVNDVTEAIKFENPKLRNALR